MTKLESKIKEMKSYCDAATSGEWEFKATKDTGGIRFVFAPNEEKDHRGCEFVVADVNRSFNAQFIANARTDFPNTLAALEYIREEIRRNTDSDFSKHCDEQVLKFLEGKG